MKTSTVDMKDVLFILTTEDIEFFYDARLERRGKEGSFRALSSSDRKTLKEYVKRNLEHGLGTAWEDYMDISVDLAITAMDDLNKGD